MSTMFVTEDYIRVHLRVTGLVQGVGFRYWTRGLALRMMLAGHVQNMADGSVEIVTFGPEKDIQTFLRAVRQGPSGAVVENLVVLDRRVSSRAPDDFTVVR